MCVREKESVYGVYIDLYFCFCIVYVISRVNVTYVWFPPLKEAYQEEAAHIWKPDKHIAER